MKKSFSLQKTVQNSAERIAERAFDIALKKLPQESRFELILKGREFRKEIEKTTQAIIYETIINNLSDAILKLLNKEKK